MGKGNFDQNRIGKLIIRALKRMAIFSAQLRKHLINQRTHVDEARVVVECTQVRPRERQEGVEPRREVLRESEVKPLHQPPYCLAGFDT